MKNTYILALIFSLALGYFLYVYFGIIFIVFIPPVFVYLFNKYNKKQYSISILNNSAKRVSEPIKQINLLYSKPLTTLTHLTCFLLTLQLTSSFKYPYQHYSKSFFVTIGETSTTIFRSYFNLVVYYPTSNPITNFCPSWVVRLTLTPDVNTLLLYI